MTWSHATSAGIHARIRRSGRKSVIAVKLTALLSAVIVRLLVERVRLGAPDELVGRDLDGAVDVLVGVLRRAPAFRAA
jgi:hypothetical protein